MLIITLKRLLILYQRESFRSDYTIKELIIENENLIPANFKTIKFEVLELKNSSFSMGHISSKNDILFCLNLNCPSCVILAHKIRFLANSKFNLNIVIQINNIHIYNINSPLICECIHLIIIFQELGILAFSRSIIASKITDNKLKLFEKIIHKHQIIVDEDRRQEVWHKLNEQKHILNKNSILEFPYIIQNMKVIPPYIDPKYYDVIL